MKVTTISENTKRKTAMLTIVHDRLGRKRSETRHCRTADDGFRGWLLDDDRAELERLEAESKSVAADVDRLNAMLQTKAKRATAYNPALLFVYQPGQDNGVEYAQHVNAERSKALNRINRLKDEREPLQMRVELQREEAKKEAQMVAAAYIGAAVLRNGNRQVTRTTKTR